MKLAEEQTLSHTSGYIQNGKLLMLYSQYAVRCHVQYIWSTNINDYNCQQGAVYSQTAVQEMQCT